MLRFDVDPQALFDDRTAQLRSWGIRGRTIAAVRARVVDMWREGPGGWAFEWMREAESAEGAGERLRAALLYGAAKFPCAVTELQLEAYRRQVQCYRRASHEFRCSFEREVLEVPYRDRTTPVAVHLLAPPRRRDARALICLSGGLDALKVEMHRFAVVLAAAGGFRVAIVDMPGTGESRVPLDLDSHCIYGEVLDALRDRTSTAAVGVGFGGHFAAKLGLTDVVDAAVDVGGPIGEGVRNPGLLRSFPVALDGTVANALGLSHVPSAAELRSRLDPFSLRRQGLLQERPRASLLAINGAHDPYVAPEDTTVFCQLPRGTGWLVPRAGHCASERMGTVVAGALGWLRTELLGPRPVDRVLQAAARRALRAR